MLKKSAFQFSKSQHSNAQKVSIPTCKKSAFKHVKIHHSNTCKNPLKSPTENQTPAACKEPASRGPTLVPEKPAFKCSKSQHSEKSEVSLLTWGKVSIPLQKSN